MPQIPSKALDDIMERSAKIVGQEALRLKTDLVVAAPVATGVFKANWQMRKISDLKWQIFNPTEYGSILWAGIRTVGNRTYGSHKWPEGGDPMLNRASLSITKRLASIRR